MPPSPTESDANAQTTVDMGHARSTTTVNVDDISVFLHHGKDEWLTRKKVVGVLETDEVLDKSKRDFMTRTEIYEHAILITNRIYELQVLHGWSEQETKLAFASVDLALPINLHNIAFEPVFNLNAGPTLFKKYGPLIATRAIIGCYLQTELGHGTNVSRLETTANYIQDSQEFEIHSPTLTSTKWWIGGPGKTATHGVVQAKLILHGKDMGPHLFLAQLRSLENHRVLPQITIGDIGPKAMGGFATTDNGYARFDRVRIPKENMLSAFAQVTDDGRYIQPPHAKLSYGGMLYIRSSMVTSGGWNIAKAATISIRYATVRRQGELGSDGLEKQIISYPSVYYRLLPILSRAYTFIILGRSLATAFTTMADRLKQRDTSLLAELHATTSGLKVLVTTTGVQDIETARRALGGHGYSAFSGLGRLYADYLPSTTYEGDNFVLDQQVVRAALKTYKRLFSTEARPSVDSLSPSSTYLRHLLRLPGQGQTHVPTPISEQQWRDPATAVDLLEYRAALMVHDHTQNTARSDANINQRLSKAITEAFVAVQVAEIIKSLRTRMNRREASVLELLFLLYLLTTVEGALVDLLSFNLLSPLSTSRSTVPTRGTEVTDVGVHPSVTVVPTSSGIIDPVRSLRHTIDALCRELLPEAIGLTDAFDFTDWELDSALGVKDGRVYESLWESAKREPLNRKEVPDAYEQSIKPILRRGLEILQEQRKSKL